VDADAAAEKMVAKAERIDGGHETNRALRTRGIEFAATELPAHQAGTQAVH
jgi:hypothetical protein